jgi:hypothetical protein
MYDGIGIDILFNMLVLGAVLWAAIGLPRRWMRRRAERQASIDACRSEGLLPPRVDR